MGREESRLQSSGAAENHPADILIRLNGEDRRIPENLTIAGLLAHLGLKQDRVAVEVDREIVRRPDWEGRRLTNGEAVEIVHFVGGG